MQKKTTINNFNYQATNYTQAWVRHTGWTTDSTAAAAFVVERAETAGNEIDLQIDLLVMRREALAAAAALLGEDEGSDEEEDEDDEEEEDGDSYGDLVRFEVEKI
jgi:hypothetical protein